MNVVIRVMSEFVHDDILEFGVETACMEQGRAAGSVLSICFVEFRIGWQEGLNDRSID